MSLKTPRRIVTVFGASGFIGRHLVRRLARDGWVVRACCRDTEKASYLRTMGDVGQVIPWGVKLLDDNSVRSAINGAEAVVNLIGILYQSRGFSFETAHHQVAKRIAEISKEYGIESFVHMSALGADKNSDSQYAQTKAAGEEAVREALPSTRIVRPSVVFGPEDNFFNMFAGMCRVTPCLPVFGAEMVSGAPGGPKFQPVYVGDVADAIIVCLNDASTAGKTYELVGPSVYDFAEIMELVLTNTNRSRALMPIPFCVAEVMAFFMELLPKPLLTRDQIKLMKIDNVGSGNLPGLADLGINPHPAEAVLPTYLRRYRTPLKQTRVAGS